MRTPMTPNPPLDVLLAELEAAVRAGNHTRARELERAILQRLTTEAVEQAEMERRVRDLMAELELPPSPPPTKGRPRGGPVRGIEEAATAAEGVVCPVWFGTNRKPDLTGDGFTGDRSNEVTRGRVDVFIPRSHRFGSTGSTFFEKLKRLDFSDDTLRIQAIEKKDREAFFAEIKQANKGGGGEPPQALVFIHGYRTSFEEAAIRAAQIGCDLKTPGATAFFSWPSRGTLAAYPADEASIEASEAAITNFLVDFTANCGAEKTHIIAHSMGNRGLLRALQRIAADATTRGKVRFGQIFLAAPDIDRDLFLDLAPLYTQHAERTTLYASGADLPVHVSSKFHDAPRAGYFEPYTVTTGIDTLAVPDFDIDLLGHSYFAQAEALLHDIYDLMRSNRNPNDRQRIESAASGASMFWRFRL